MYYWGGRFCCILVFWGKAEWDCLLYVLLEICDVFVMGIFVDSSSSKDCYVCCCCVANITDRDLAAWRRLMEWALTYQNHFNCLAQFGIKFYLV